MINLFPPWLHRRPLANSTSSKRAQLWRRAQRIAQVRHPNLVPMLPLPGGAGLTPLANQGHPLSDFTPGGTFKRFELEQVVRLVLDVLSGLTALHQDFEDGVGFLHGQVSPQVIYLSADGTVRLLPLLSRHWMPEAQPSSTGYTAPEILLGERADPRFDLFSVGAMLWEALAGTPLFPDPSLEAVLARWQGGKLPPLVARVNSPQALALCAIAERAISPYPVLRFQSAVELSKAIVAAAAPPVAKPQVAVAKKPLVVVKPEEARPQLLVEAPALIQTLPAAPHRTLTPPATVFDVEPAQVCTVEAGAGKSQTRAVLDAVRRATLGREWVVGLAAAGLAAAVVLMLFRPASAARPSAAAPSPPTLPIAVAPVVPSPEPESPPPAAPPPLPSTSASVLAPGSAPSVFVPAPPSYTKRSSAQRNHDRRQTTGLGDYGI